MMSPGQAGRMMQRNSLGGILVPLITPFAADGRIAFGALGALAREVLDAGATGIVALGSTAEASTLDPAERRAVIELCAAVCGPRGAPLAVGAGGFSDTRASAAALALPGRVAPDHRRAGAGAVLHPAGRGRRAGPLHPAGRGEPGAAGRLSHPVPHGAAAELRRAARTGPAAERGRDQVRHQLPGPGGGTPARRLPTRLRRAGR